jgi:hypothetical protein
MRAGIGVAVLIAATCSLAASCTPWQGCISYSRARSRSPDGALDAVVFDYGCGAPTSLRTYVALVPRGEEPGELSSRVFMTAHQTDVDAVWTAGRELTIYHSNDVPAAYQDALQEGVRIRAAAGVRCGSGWRTDHPTPAQLAGCAAPAT